MIEHSDLSSSDQGSPRIAPEGNAGEVPVQRNPGGDERRQRSQGRVRLVVERMDNGETRVRDLAESGPLRIRLPRQTGKTCEAVLLNTAGGLACGDHFAIEAHLGPGADLVLTTTAAEKIYRSDGPVSRIETRIALEAGARLCVLPQETILFDQAMLRRRFTADLAGNARLLAFEAVAFGRAARAERIESGLFEETWRIRREGRLVYADTLRLEGALSDHLARATLGGGARAMATLIDVAPEAEGRLEAMRALIEGSDAGAARVEAAASAWNGRLVARVLSPDPDALRRTAAQVLTGYRGVALPRVWQG
jgi:urease accessory protein